MSFRRSSGIVLATVMFASSCAPSAAPAATEIEDGFVVPEGKADDFLSLSAREFLVEGTTTVTIEPALASASETRKLERARELIGLKHIAIAWFLTQYLIDKDDHGTTPDNRPSFSAMAKAGSYEELDITAVDSTTYSFRFIHVIAGKPTLLQSLPLRAGPGGKREFVLTVGRVSNEELAQLETNHEWYRRAPWTSWNPETATPAQKEDLVLSIRNEETSSDAWFDYAALLDDGVLSIDAHFGWDYHAALHVTLAKRFFSWLVQQGFEPPVREFESLTRRSRPFTRTIDANGRAVRVEVRLFYGKDGAVTDPDTDAGGRALEGDMRTSLRARDVIAYVGHSGPFYGFALANWRMTEEGDLDDTEMETAEMPAERYQIVLAEGCDTYMIGEAFRRNPAKPEGRFIDVVTTTSFSNASSGAAVHDLIASLIAEDSAGSLRPSTMKSLLTDLDSNSSWFNTMYGIHGIDDNPALHPFANVEALCTSCTRNADCGGVGNSCVTLGSSGRRCVAACTDTRGCPTDYACQPLASTTLGGIYGSACVPRAFECR